MLASAEMATIRSKQPRKHAQIGLGISHDVEVIEEETEEERIALIKWEKQWWRNIDASIRV